MAEWEVYALKYAERNARTRADSFIFDPNHDAQHDMDYYVWLMRNGAQTVLVDTGYDMAEAKRRDRPIQISAPNLLKPFDLTPEDITDVIITHLHYDHAGSLHLFPNARLHIQAAEMAYATGPCMCHDALKMPFTADHICEAVKRLYSGKVIFYDGEATIFDDVSVHRIGGHSRGLQAVRVRTQAGWLVLASDASHYYENFMARKPFPIVVDLQDMMDGFDILSRLTDRPEMVVPGHDPMVRQMFRSHSAPFVTRLDLGPVGKLPL